MTSTVASSHTREFGSLPLPVTETQALLRSRRGSSSDDGATICMINHKLYAIEGRHQVVKALPMTIAGIMRSFITIIELQALGHIGSKELAGRSLALMLVNLTGYLFMYGLGGALESMCSQAYTASRQQRKMGVYVQHSLVVFAIGNVFVALLWLNPQFIFSLFAQADREVIGVSKVYLLFECIYFPCIVVQTCLKRFLLAQGLMLPTIYFEAAGLVSMIISVNVFVWNPSTSLGFYGVPLSATISYVMVLLTNALYIYYTPKCREEWGEWTMNGIVKNSKQIIKLAIPCAASGVASYGFSDIATVFVTVLGTESLAIQAVLNSTKSAISRIGSYLGMVISNRVGNLIGAADAQRAKLAARVNALLALIIGLVVCLPIVLLPRTTAEFFTKSPGLIDGLVPLMPLLGLLILFDILSNIFSGILRGQGRPGVAAIVRIISLYLLAIPVAYALCFWAGLGLFGLWIGLVFGFVTISVAEATLIKLTDWDDEVTKCLERVNGSA